MDDKIASQTQMFANRLQKRFRHLKKWAQRTGVGAFRLYDRDIPEIPLVLDFYGNTADINDAALTCALYKRPYEKDEDDENKWLSAMKESVSSSLGIALDNIFVKQREKQRGLSQYEKIARAHSEKIINEYDLKFKINLSDYLDTGLFTDRRLLRAIIRSESNEKKVLNLFCYTGVFSIYAAAGGAVSTDSVDLSNTYLNWAKENFSINNIPLEGKHNLIRSDVSDYINKAVKAKMKWDIIVADPPAFSNSKKMTDNFDLNRDLTDLLIKCLAALEENGKIFTSINLRRGAPSARELEEELRRKLNLTDLQVIDLDNKIIDEDFKGRKIPKAFLIRRQIFP